MTEKFQIIFKRATVDKLRLELRRGNGFKSYFQPSINIKQDEVLTSSIPISDKRLSLKVPAKNAASADLENAIKFYEFYKMNETQASDPRLWAYLTHVEYRDYVLKRWGLSGTAKEYGAEERSKAINQLFDHWFVMGSDRDLRRNALSRLWWLVHLTVSPETRDPDYFSDLKLEDPYFFTRVLLFTQDIYASVLERGMGRSRRILISILEFLHENPSFAESREKVRSLLKELNLLCGVKRLDTLSRAKLKETICQLAVDLN